MELIKIQTTLSSLIIFSLLVLMTFSLPTRSLPSPRIPITPGNADSSENPEFPLYKLASSRHGSSYGTSYIVVPNNQSHPGKKSIEVDPLALLFGAKAIALKAFLISQFLTTTTTPRPGEGR